MWCLDQAVGGSRRPKQWRSPSSGARGGDLVMGGVSEVVGLNITRLHVRRLCPPKPKFCSKSPVVGS